MGLLQTTFSILILLLKHYETVNCSNRIKLNRVKELSKKERNDN